MVFLERFLISCQEVFRHSVLSEVNLFRNVAWLGLAKVVNTVLPLALLPYLLTTLGPEEFGTLVLSQSLVAYFTLITNYGFDLSASRRIAARRESREHVSKCFSETLVAKTVLATACLLLLVLLLEAFPILPFERSITYFAATILIGNVLFPFWYFVGSEQLKYVTIGLFVSRLITLVATILLVKSPNDTWLAAMTYALGSIIAGAGATLLVVKSGEVSFNLPSLRRLRRSLEEGWYVFLSTAAISLYTTSTSLFLGLIAGPTALGYFAAADKLKTGIQSLLEPLGQAFFPRLSFLVKSDLVKAIRLLRLLLFLQVGIGLFLSLSLFLAAPFIVSNFLGEAFVDAVPLLKILSFSILAVSLSNILGIQFLLTLGHNREFSQVTLAAGAACILLLWTAIPFAGAIGAAYTVTTIEFFVVLLFLLVLKQKKLLSKLWGTK